MERQPSLLDKKLVVAEKESTKDFALTSSINLTETISREINLQMVIVRPLYEFSFNHLEFSSTPGGSYSMITTELRPFKYSEKSCCCGWDKEGKTISFRSIFRIAGNTQEVRIEPMSGVLEHGEVNMH